MTFLVQFKRYRRGVLEVIGTLPVAAADGAAALAFAQSPAGMRRWPVRTDALRVMDDGGRTLLDWTMPVEIAQPVIYSPTRVSTKATGKEPRPAPLVTAERSKKGPSTHAVDQHRFAVGQSVSYAEDGRPEVWNGGYEIVRLDDPRGEPQYAIRSADQSYDRIVHEHELREDLGARARGR
ncbi:hypothetical protein HPT29_026945 (plasmid) [Microvirga terrae]|uniref:Uncharacterized protein n=1 Tax=Microvirga terrae TaxID=2740529 RepID=A0ABY5RYI1_9HYPH|nr:hypothetical protein [Microvirga terrae]UVF22321.1 hypothetical protein HPT29_026945 [Microvirga terrae]